MLASLMGLLVFPEARAMGVDNRLGVKGDIRGRPSLDTINKPAI